MTLEQTAIALPAFSPLRPIVPVVVTGPRCWILGPSPEDDGYGYPMETHYPTETAFRDVYATFEPDAKTIRLPFVCVTPRCIRCRGAYADSEYGGAIHFPSWVEAERVARIDGWRIGPRGEFVCPDCGEGR